MLYAALVTLVAVVAEALEWLDNRRCCLVVFHTLTATLQSLAIPDDRTQECEVVVVVGSLQYFQKVHRLALAGKAVAGRNVAGSFVAVEEQIAVVAALTAVAEDQLVVVAVEKAAVVDPTVVAVRRTVAAAVARLTVVVAKWIVVVVVVGLSAAAAEEDYFLELTMAS